MAERKKAAPKPTGKKRRQTKRTPAAKEAVAAIEAEAEDESPIGDRPGPEGDAYSKVQRDIDVFRAHLRGLDTYDIAAAYQLHPKTVQEIVRGMRSEHRRITNANPMEVIEELTMQIDAGISELATQATKNKGAVRVNAVVARIRAIFQKADFLQEVGVLPKSADTLRIQFEAAGFVERLLDMLERKGLLDDELVAEVERTFADSGGLQIDLDESEIKEDVEAIALGAGD
jgi:hypothetical protein